MNKLLDIIIPCAGLGTRMLPVTKGKKSKLMLKIREKTLLQYAIDEAVSSGIKNIHIIANNKDILYWEKPRNNKTIIYAHLQKKPLGLINALQQAKKSIKGTHVGIIFPDIIIKSKEPAITQMKKDYEKYGKKIIGILSVNKEKRKIFGKAGKYVIRKRGMFFLKKNLRCSSQHQYYIGREILAIKDIKKGVTEDELINKAETIRILEGTYYDCGIPKGYYYTKKQLERTKQ